MACADESAVCSSSGPHTPLAHAVSTLAIEPTSVHRGHEWHHIFPTAFADKSPPPLNVFGKPLKPCVNEDATGFNRDNFCVDPSGADANHHEVCAAITPKFWPESLQGPADKDAPHGNWCICVHKYSEWLNLTKGKGAGIKFLDCDATSMEALKQGEPGAEQAIAEACKSHGTVQMPSKGCCLQ